jgi:hypothetical protein
MFIHVTHRAKASTLAVAKAIYLLCLPWSKGVKATNMIIHVALGAKAGTVTIATVLAWSPRASRQQV